MEKKLAKHPDVNRALNLLLDIKKLQVDIFEFHTDLEEKGYTDLSELVAKAGYEMNSSYSIMQEAIKKLRAIHKKARK